jgi:hypothetical protein
MAIGATDFTTITDVTTITTAGGYNGWGQPLPVSQWHSGTDAQ